MHVAREINAGETQVFTFTVPSYTPAPGTGNDQFFLDLWCGDNSDFSATVISPNGIRYTRNAGESGDGPARTDGTITLWNYTSALNGHRNIQTWVHDADANVPRSGTWSLSVTNNSPGTVSCHGWLVYRTVGTAAVTVTGANTERTVSMPGTSASAITVGSYVTKWGWPSYNGSFYTLSVQRIVPTTSHHSAA